MKKTIVISCAGMGTRLGKNMPKCLIDIDGKTLIERNLEHLNDIDEIIVVVGYKKDEVINKVKQYSDNIKFVENIDYEKTSTGASFTLGAKAARNDYIIALDGDLLMHPNDLENIIKNVDYEFIGGVIPSTEDPVYIEVQDNKAIGFNRTSGDYEWSGIAGIYKNNIVDGKWYVFNILEEILPAKIYPVRAREIDTPNDYNEAIRWMKNNYDN